VTQVKVEKGTVEINFWFVDSELPCSKGFEVPLPHCPIAVLFLVAKLLHGMSASHRTLRVTAQLTLSSSSLAFE
jgi:hypothetical protein